ncbi:MAG: hypothetical protein Q9213_001352 [Squamulea squamosa]
MPYSDVIGGVSGLITRNRKTTTGPASRANPSKSSLATTLKTSTAANTTYQTTFKRCTVCPIPHNSSIAHEKRLGLRREPGRPSLFDRLVPELRTLVYRHLAVSDVLRLRLTCRSLLNLLGMDMGEIIRCLVKKDTSISMAHSLTRGVIDTSMPTAGHLIALSHRCHVAEALGRFLATFHLKEVYSCKSAAALARSPHAHKVDIMIDNMRPYLILISHMLEVYRTSVAKIVQGTRSTKEMKSLACRAEREITKQYALADVTSLVFEMLKKTLFRQLRPASYATALERMIRGWTEPSANDDKAMSLIVFGGVDAINQVINKSTYNTRIRALEDWLYRAGVSELPRPRTEETIQHQSLKHGLGPATIQRMKTILPDRSYFFDKWALTNSISPANSTGEPRSMIVIPKPDPVTFQLWLRSEKVRSDFDLRA